MGTSLRQWDLPDPYCEVIPDMKRPRQDLGTPLTREEKLYCWFFWIEAILEPKLTREVLELIDRLPEFVTPWQGFKTHNGVRQRLEKEGFLLPTMDKKYIRTGFKTKTL